MTIPHGSFKSVVALARVWLLDNCSAFWRTQLPRCRFCVPSIRDSLSRIDASRPCKQTNQQAEQELQDDADNSTVLPIALGHLDCSASEKRDANISRLTLVGCRHGGLQRGECFGVRRLRHRPVATRTATHRPRALPWPRLRVVLERSMGESACCGLPGRHALPRWSCRPGRSGGPSCGPVAVRVCRRGAI